MPEKLSACTVQRVLRKMGMDHRRLISEPLLTKNHKGIRQEYMAKFGIWSIVKWKNVVFSDE